MSQAQHIKNQKYSLISFKLIFQNLLIFKNCFLLISNACIFHN